MKIYIYMLFSLLIVANSLFVENVSAQKKQERKVITGKVINTDGEPLAGVLVTADEGVSKAISTANGTFELYAYSDEEISLKKIGYEQQVIKKIEFDTAGNIATLDRNEIFTGTSNNVNLPFKTIERKRIAGLVSVISAEAELARDTRYNIGSAIGGKVAGMQGSWNIHGLGNATVVIDGVPRSVTNFNLQEVEQITVLKDPISRMLYGADSDAGVIFITTKKGELNKNKISANLEQGIQTAIAYPKYLNAATYMQKYNEAWRNDGNLSDYYSQELIGNTRGKVDPVLYPDNNYLGEDMVGAFTNFTNFYAEASGGNQRAQYFINLGWKHNEGWIKAAEKDNSDLFSVRGNVAYKVNDWLKMNTDVVAIFDISNRPNCGDFWSQSTTVRPNEITQLLPISRISNFDQLDAPTVIDGQYLLGGSGLYQSNVYADLLRKGTQTTLDRYLQFNTGLDFDLSRVTPGLTAKAFLTFDFTNKFVQLFANQYAVYEPTTFDADGNFNVVKIGEDKVTTQKSVDAANMYFNRNFGLYATINYNRTFFDKHAISAVGVAYATQFTEKSVFQQKRRLNFGVQGNYMFDSKYIVEGGVMVQGSSKLAPENRMGAAPSGALAWIVSNEGFLSDSDIIDYLKIRTGYGLLLNDNWTAGTYNGYFLYEPYYQQGGVFNYYNGTYKNNEMNAPSVRNNITWQKRKEFTAGFEAYMFNERFWIEATYFNSLSYNNLTSVSNAPATLGDISRYWNYNATRYAGFEVGVKYREQLADFKIETGLNLLYSKGKITQRDEAVYNTPETQHLSSVGKASDSMWGLTSLGLYTAADFDQYGQLSAELPTVSYGSVQEGDIKYLDYNGDGIINDDDRSVIGNSSNRLQVGVTIDLSYKNWQLFVLGTGAYGGKGYTNSNYYWLRGTTAKYSEVALQSYHPVNNPDSNAQYPRLTTTNGNNNYRNSTFWMYDKSQFSLAAVQLGYNLKLKPSSPVSNIAFYLRGSNLLTIAKDKDILQLSVGSTPQSRVFALGIVTTF